MYVVWVFVGGGAEERENPTRAPHPARGARHETQSHNPEVMTSAEIKSRMLSQLSHPGAPNMCILNTCSLGVVSRAHR